MYCKHCGRALERDARFCPGCGKQVGSGSTGNRVRCPNCGSDDVHFVTTQTSQNFDTSDACCGYLLCGPLGLLLGVNGRNETRTVRKCMSCGHEF